MAHACPALWPALCPGLQTCASKLGVLPKPLQPTRACPFLLDGDQKKCPFSLLACSGRHVASSTTSAPLALRSRIHAFPSTSSTLMASASTSSKQANFSSSVHSILRASFPIQPPRVASSRKPPPMGQSMSRNSAFEQTTFQSLNSKTSCSDSRDAVTLASAAAKKRTQRV